MLVVVLSGCLGARHRMMNRSDGYTPFFMTRMRFAGRPLGRKGSAKGELEKGHGGGEESSDTSWQPDPPLIAHFKTVASV